jgi:hypothetical protein
VAQAVHFQHLLSHPEVRWPDACRSRSEQSQLATIIQRAVLSAALTYAVVTIIRLQRRRKAAQHYILENKHQEHILPSDSTRPRPRIRPARPRDWCQSRTRRTMDVCRRRSASHTALDVGRPLAGLACLAPGLEQTEKRQPGLTRLALLERSVQRNGRLKKIQAAARPEVSVRVK